MRDKWKISRRLNRLITSRSAENTLTESRTLNAISISPLSLRWGNTQKRRQADYKSQGLKRTSFKKMSSGYDKAFMNSQHLWLPEQYQASQNFSMSAAMVHVTKTPSWEAVASWRLVEEGKSLSFKVMACDRSPVFQWMAWYPCVQRQH